ncbi:MAG: hypothetical protein Hens3KO_04470 [Henriciella sp.]
MTDVETAQAPKPADTIMRLDQARTKSGWLAWGGFVLALAWWGAAITGTIVLLTWPVIEQAQPALIVAGTIAILLPGFMLLLAGFFAREQVRAGATNAIVLEAAAKLLTPAESMGADATAFANEMSAASANVDRSMGHALSAMRAMAGEIGDERQRLESVTYASADNARELADRLGTERSALETLTKELREQSAMIGDAIPKQADMIVQSAKSAAAEVASAESALEARLVSLDQTGRTLAQKIAAMDTLAAEAGQRNETLLFAIARMEEKLEQSRKTVETASRAGELAAAAAGTTGDRLMEAVRAALEGAREASVEIQNRTLETSESAARALAQLKDAGQQASAAVRAAGMAARAEMDIAERRAAQASNSLHQTPQSNGTSSASSVEPLAASASHGQSDRTETVTAAPAPTPSLASPSRTVDDDLFDASADRMAQAMLQAAQTDTTKPSNGGPADALSPMKLRDGLIPDDENDVFDEDTLIAPPTINTGGEASKNGNSLSDIIADMEREEQPALTREETAEKLLDRLEDSGIKLTHIFRPKDKKKIAFAARKGEKQRKSSINQAAGRQVERVRQRLRGDPNLMAMAKDFITLEEADALSALENTHASNKNASARLATYLLLDSALTD